jgi:general stress protein YciG
MVKVDLSKYMQKIGRKGGKKSGKARLVKLTPEQRSEIARKAAAARWGKRNPKPDGSK